MAWAPDYASADEMSAYLRIDDTVDAAEIVAAIGSASRGVDDWAKRQFGKVDEAEARIYVAHPDYERGGWTVDVDDFQTTNDLVVTVDGNAVATFVKGPRNAAQKGRPWTRLAFTSDSEYQPSSAPHEVAVTAIWGWTEVPRPVVLATMLQANRLLKRRDSPFGVAGSPDVGSELRLLARLDPDVAVLLRGNRRIGGVG